MSADENTSVIPLPPALAAVIEEMVSEADELHRKEAGLRYRTASLLREFLGVGESTRLMYMRDERAVQVHQQPATNNDAAT